MPTMLEEAFLIIDPARMSPLERDSLFVAAQIRPMRWASLLHS
jgi:hypothetical protein